MTNTDPMLTVFSGSAGGHLVLFCQQGSECPRPHEMLLFTLSVSIIPPFISAFGLYPSKVQSEILKKWKRWKLGRNIEEEYRHTYSNTPNTKTGSLLNHISQLPRLPDITTSSGPVCSPEETHMLVAGCHNGLLHGEGGGNSTSEQNKGTSNCTLMEDIHLTDEMQCYDARFRKVESHLWTTKGARTWCWLWALAAPVGCKGASWLSRPWAQAAALKQRLALYQPLPLGRTDPVLWVLWVDFSLDVWHFTVWSCWMLNKSSEKPFKAAIRTHQTTNGSKRNKCKKTQGSGSKPLL